MSERTPNMNTIRHAWLKGHPFPLTTDVEERMTEFDRALAAHDAEVREAERERAALHAEEGYRMEERCDDIAQRIRSGEPAEISARPRVVAEEPEWEFQVVNDDPKNEYEGGPITYAEALREANMPGDRIERRRKAGPWVPVKQEGAPTDG